MEKFHLFSAQQSKQSCIPLHVQIIESLSKWVETDQCNNFLENRQKCGMKVYNEKTKKSYRKIYFLLLLIIQVFIKHSVCFVEFLISQ